MTQVFEPLKEMIISAPLEDARLLTYRYRRIRQDMESQVKSSFTYTPILKSQVRHDVICLLYFSPTPAW